MRSLLQRSRRSIVLLCLVAGAIGSFAPAAGAHAVLLSTDPSPNSVLDEQPATISATFNESVEISFGAFRVYDTDGERVDDGEAGYVDGDLGAIEVGLQEDLPEGTYTATYRVVSADSHVIKGAFVFHIGAPGEKPRGIASQVLGDSDRPGPQIAYGVARWTTFAGLLTLIGAAFFYTAIWLRRRPTPSARPAAVEEDAGRRFGRLMLWSYVALVVSSIASYVLQTAIAGDLPVAEALSPGNLTELAGTRFGSVMIVRFAVLFFIGIAWLMTVRIEAITARAGASASVGAAAQQPIVPLPAVIVGSIALLALAATPGLAGHPGSTDPVVLNVFADVVHVVGAGVWIGGLVALLGIGFGATRRLEPSGRSKMLAPVVARFSDIALISVAAVVLTGIYRSWVEVQAWRGLTETPYGVVLLAKIVVFLPILALGAINNRVFKPRLEASAEAGDGAGAKLKRLVAAEVALGVVVVAFTALLVNIAPAKTELGVDGPYVTDVAVGDQNLNLIVDPNEVGENIVHFTLSDADGLPVDVREMKATFLMREDEVGPIAAETRQLGPGHYIVQGRELSIPGRWEIAVEIVYDRFSTERAVFTVEVNR